MTSTTHDAKDAARAEGEAELKEGEGERLDWRELVERNQSAEHRDPTEPGLVFMANTPDGGFDATIENAKSLALKLNRAVGIRLSITDDHGQAALVNDSAIVALMSRVKALPPEKVAEEYREIGNVAGGPTSVTNIYVEPMSGREIVANVNAAARDYRDRKKQEAAERAERLKQAAHEEHAERLKRDLEDANNSTPDVVVLAREHAQRAADKRWLGWFSCRCNGGGVMVQSFLGCGEVYCKAEFMRLMPPEEFRRATLVLEAAHFHAVAVIGRLISRRFRPQEILAALATLGVKQSVVYDLVSPLHWAHITTGSTGITITLLGDDVLRDPSKHGRTAERAIEAGAETADRAPSPF